MIFSDSHRTLAHMLDAIELERPDRIFHLGDLTRDAEDLSAAYPQIQLESVSGNCDGWIAIPPERLLTIEGHTILMGHGHTWHVKSGLQTALRAAHHAGADILLYGHTHIPTCFQQDNLWVMNPGSARNGQSKASYGVITLESGSITCGLRYW